MDTIPAFYDDHFHAVRAAIEGSERSYKEVAGHLWPSMKPMSAYARLKACTHDGGDQKLDLAEILAICRYVNRYDPLYYLCAETMHDRPRQHQAAEMAQTLVQQLATQGEEFRRTSERLESLVKANPGILKSVA